MRFSKGFIVFLGIWFAVSATGTVSGILIGYQTWILLSLVAATCIPGVVLIVGNLSTKSTAESFITNNTVETMINEFSIKQSIAKDEEARKAALQNRIDTFISQNTLKLTQKEHYDTFIRKLCLELEAVQGAMYITTKKNNINHLIMSGTFAYAVPESQIISFEFGEGIAGTAAKEGRMVHLKELPDGYLTVLSGLGKASPKHLLVVPILNAKNETQALVEIATFKALEDQDEKFVQSVVSKLTFA